MERIKSEHRKILDTIRALYIQSGGKPLYDPEDFGGLNKFYKSKTSDYEVSFNYGIPKRLYTSEGSYVILGSSVVGNCQKFWELLHATFNVTIIKPQCDDAFRLQWDIISGPIVKIVLLPSTELSELVVEGNKKIEERG